MQLRSLITSAVITAALIAPPPDATADPDLEQSPAPTGLVLPIERALSTLPAAPVAAEALPPQPQGLRIALISSGVDAGVLPTTLQKRLTHLGSTGDSKGYGTYATTVLLQLAPTAEITSIGVYPNGRFNSDWQTGALDWVVKNASKLDAVLYAVPPHEFLDPISVAMADGTWDSLLDLMSDRPLRTERGAFLGISTDSRLRNLQMRNASAGERLIAEQFVRAQSRWQHARDAVKKLSGAGVPFIAPAGDLGGEVGRIMGVANLPEVITVGGFDGTAASSLSSSGPSIDGRVKPDLIAPTGIPAFFPEGSEVAVSLSRAGLTRSDIEPLWDEGAPRTSARAFVDSTIGSAAYAAVAAATLASKDAGGGPMIKGLLTRAATPLDGVPVWRQGAGVLTETPAPAAGGVALANGDLGLNPESGTWAETIPFSEQVSGAKTTITDFAGVGPAGTYTDRRSYPVAASVGNEGVTLTLPTSGHNLEAGLYCGYTEVTLPGSGSDLRPSASVDGAPVAIEQVPTCLVQGTRLSAFNFYIHDLPAEHLTFGLLPALPKEVSFLEKPFMVLPIDPLHTKLFVKASGNDGYAHFNNIPPGHYRLRQWSDYGAPITQLVSDSKTGKPVEVSRDIGENPSYQSFDALVLSSTGWSKSELERTFGKENVTADKPTGGYFVNVAGRRTRVVLDQVKKMPGAGVASRYIDLVNMQDFSYLSADLSRVITAASLRSLTTSQKAWTFESSSDTGTLGTFHPGMLTTGWNGTTGIAQYPFRLTTPNYKAQMNLNFSYALENAIVVIVVQAGEDTAVAAVTPEGSFALPTIGTGSPINLGQLQISGRGDGKAHFDFHMLPKGAGDGMLTLLYVPTKAVGNLLSPVSRAQLDDFSFELDTWTNTLWPAASTSHGQGHTFSFSSNFSERQMKDACRRIDNSAVEAEVCEEWDVLVHSPGDDAATVDLVDATGSLARELRAAGGGYYDPRRGKADFTTSFSFDQSLLAATSQLDLALPMKTNGRFWEQLKIPTELLRKHPGAIEVQIVDNLHGRSSQLAPHHHGAAAVGPYVPFRAGAKASDLRL